MGAQKSTPNLEQASLDDIERPLESPRPRAHEQAMDAQKSTPKLGEASLCDIEHRLLSPATKRPETHELLHRLSTTVLDEVSYTHYTGDNLILLHFICWCLASSPGPSPPEERPVYSVCVISRDS